MALILLVMGSALAQETTIASVASIADLKRAVKDQVQHIVIQTHLDLTNEQPRPSPGGSQVWLLSLQGVQSIRVRARSYMRFARCTVYCVSTWSGIVRQLA